jgi:hypothetical protein
MIYSSSLYSVVELICNSREPINYRISYLYNRCQDRPRRTKEREERGWNKERMVQERIKQFTGDPSFIEVEVNTFLAQSGDNIDLVDFRIVDTANGGSSAPKNVLYLLYKLRRE